MRGNGQECQMGMIPDGTLRESLMTTRSLVISVLAEAEGSSITKMLTNPPRHQCSREQCGNGWWITREGPTRRVYDAARTTLAC